MAAEFKDFVLDERVYTKVRGLVELYKVALAFFINESGRVNSECLYYTEGPGDSEVRHCLHECVWLQVQVDKVLEVVIRGLGLGNLVMRLRLNRVDCVAELEAAAKSNCWRNLPKSGYLIVS